MALGTSSVQGFLNAELIKPITLLPYNLETPKKLAADAADAGLGAVLPQRAESE